jgi:hypothetical protein
MNFFHCPKPQKVALVLLAAVMWQQAALACSCARVEQAGFIHAAVGQLPSNARGAVFLQPQALSGAFRALEEGVHIYTALPGIVPPSSFAITSDLDQGLLPVQITPLALPGAADGMAAPRSFRFAHAADQASFGDGSRAMDWKAMLSSGRLIDIGAQVAAASRLLRVGPAGGFKAGGKYTISYKGNTDNWHYPATVAHAIDTAPVDVAGAAYALALDGPAQRKPIAQAAGGSCTAWSAEIVQEFHYVVPASEQGYAKAMVYFSAFRDDKAASKSNGRFAPLVYRPSNCAGPELGATSRGNGNDHVSTRCGPAPGRVSIRGWAGLLEVEDSLRPTGVTQIDFANAHGSSCHPFGMLKEALATQDQGRIEDALCAAGSGQNTEALPSEVPPIGEMLTLAVSGSATAKACVKGALLKLFITMPAQSSMFLERFGALLAAEIVSPDAKVAADAWETIHNLVSRLENAEDASVRSQKLLRPMYPVLLQILASGTNEQSKISIMNIAVLKKEAKPLLPALFAAAGGSGPKAGWASHALAGLMPDDLRLHRILLRQASIPATREQAALDYNDVAGARAPAKAIALLGEAARHGSGQAATMLARYGRQARSSAPALIALLQRGPGGGGEAIDALLGVTDAEPVVLAAFASSITAGPGKQLYYFHVDKFARLKQKGRALLPAIEQRMKTPMSAGRASALRLVIESMALPPAEERQVLARLAGVKTILPDD